jgi:GAF domain-containing protein
MEIPVGEALIGRAVQYRQPIAVPDVTNQPATEIWSKTRSGGRCDRGHAQISCHLAVPLMVKDEVYGGIVLYYTQAREFSEEEIGLAVSFADQVALAIENARLFDQAEQAAILEERQRLARES